MPDPSNINLLREVCGREEITLAVQNAPKKTKESHNWLSAKGKRKNSTHTHRHTHTDTVRRKGNHCVKSFCPGQTQHKYISCVSPNGHHILDLQSRRKKKNLKTSNLIPAYLEFFFS